jgi:hypothetical protein
MPRRSLCAREKRSLRVRLALAAVVLTGAASAQTGPRFCEQLTKFKITGTELVIAKAESTPAASPLPAYCRVDGTIDPRTGVGGKAYGIGFAIALPANWNGGFLFQGGGGLNGSVARPLGSQAAGDTPALARGFAVVTTAAATKAPCSMAASCRINRPLSTSLTPPSAG